MIRKACLYPPYQQLEFFAGTLEEMRGGVHFGEVLRSFDRMASLSNNFFLRGRRYEVIVADIIAEIPYLTLKERHIFTMAPMNIRMSTQTMVESHFYRGIDSDEL